MARKKRNLYFCPKNDIVVNEWQTGTSVSVRTFSVGKPVVTAISYAAVVVIDMSHRHNFTV